MANVEKLSVALTPDMAAEVRAAVAAGDYGSVSEVVRDWRLRRKIETLEADELRKLARRHREQAGRGGPAGVRALRARYAKMAR